MKYLIIYWIWVDCIISITIEKFDLCDFTKKYGQVFHSNKYKCVEKKTFCGKITLVWKITRIMLKTSISKSNFY